MIGPSRGAGVILGTAAIPPHRLNRAALVVKAGFETGSFIPLMHVGLSAMFYRYLGVGWLFDRVLTSMVTQRNPAPIVRKTIDASRRHVKLEREFPRANADELEGFTAPVMSFAAEDDPFFPPHSIVPRARPDDSTFQKSRS